MAQLERVPGELAAGTDATRPAIEPTTGDRFVLEGPYSSTSALARRTAPRAMRSPSLMAICPRRKLEFTFGRSILAPPSEVFTAWLDPRVPGTPWNAAEKLILEPKVDGLFYWGLGGNAHYGRFIDVERSTMLRHTWVSPNTLDEESMVTVASLLAYLGVAKADFLGESYGGAAGVMIALHHPRLVRRVVTVGATFGPPRTAHSPKMLHFAQPPAADSRSFAFQSESYRKVAPDPDYWPRIWEKVANLRRDGFSAEELASIRTPVLVVGGDHDFVRLGRARQVGGRLRPDSRQRKFASAPAFGDRG